MEKGEKKEKLNVYLNERYLITKRLQQVTHETTSKHAIP